ncbi:MAG: TRAP transporter small permease [Ignavibacteriales bacterium]
MDVFSNLVEKATRFCDRVAAILIFSTMAVMMVNIFMRALFGQPLTGTVDYVNVLSAVVCALAVAFCAFNNAQIAVEFLVDKLPPKWGAVIDSITNLVALGFWVLASWYLIIYAEQTQATALVSTTAHVPIYPVVYLVAVGMIMLCLVLVLKLVESVRKVAQ